MKKSGATILDSIKPYLKSLQKFGLLQAYSINMQQKSQLKKMYNITYFSQNVFSLSPLSFLPFSICISLTKYLK
jgi:hypothetical protein